MEGSQLPAGVGESVHNRGPPAPQPGHLTAFTLHLQAHLPHLHLSAESTSTELSKQEEKRREGKRQREGEREAPSVQCGFSADPERPLPPHPHPGTAGLRKGKEEAGSRRQELCDPTPGFLPWSSPSTATPPCPWGVSVPNHGRHKEQGGPSLQEEELRGGRMNGDPPG